MALEVEITLDQFGSIEIPISIRVGLMDAVQVGTLTIRELAENRKGCLSDLLEKVAAVMRTTS